MDEVHIVKGLGLNDYEARCYLHLLNYGRATAGNVAAKTKVPRPRVYDTLLSLERKGLISVQNSRPVLFKAHELKLGMENLKKNKEKDLQEDFKNIDSTFKTLLSTVKQKKADDNSGDNVWLYSGRDKIYSKLKELIGSAEKEIIVATNQENTFEKAKLVQNTKKNVTLSFLSSHPDKERLSALIGKKIDIKHNPSDSRYVIVDGKHAALFLDNKADEKNDKAVFIESKHICDLLRK